MPSYSRQSLPDTLRVLLHVGLTTVLSVVETTGNLVAAGIQSFSGGASLSGRSSGSGRRRSGGGQADLFSWLQAAYSVPASLAMLVGISLTCLASIDNFSVQNSPMAQHWVELSAPLQFQPLEIGPYWFQSLIQLLGPQQWLFQVAHIGFFLLSVLAVAQVGRTSFRQPGVGFLSSAIYAASCGALYSARLLDISALHIVLLSGITILTLHWLQHAQRPKVYHEELAQYSLGAGIFIGLGLLVTGWSGTLMMVAIPLGLLAVTGRLHYVARSIHWVQWVIGASSTLLIVGGATLLLAVLTLGWDDVLPVFQHYVGRLPFYWDATLAASPNTPLWTWLWEGSIANTQQVFWRLVQFLTVDAAPWSVLMICPFIGHWRNRRQHGSIVDMSQDGTLILLMWLLVGLAMLAKSPMYALAPLSLVLASYFSNSVVKAQPPKTLIKGMELTLLGVLLGALAVTAIVFQSIPDSSPMVSEKPLAWLDTDWIGTYLPVLLPLASWFWKSPLALVPLLMVLAGLGVYWSMAQRQFSGALEFLVWASLVCYGVASFFSGIILDERDTANWIQAFQQHQPSTLPQQLWVWAPQGRIHPSLAIPLAHWELARAGGARQQDPVMAMGASTSLPFTLFQNVAATQAEATVVLTPETQRTAEQPENHLDAAVAAPDIAPSAAALPTMPGLILERDYFQWTPAARQQFPIIHRFVVWQEHLKPLWAAPSPVAAAPETGFDDTHAGAILMVQAITAENAAQFEGGFSLNAKQPPIQPVQPSDAARPTNGLTITLPESGTGNTKPLPSGWDVRVVPQALTQDTPQGIVAPPRKKRTPEKPASETVQRTSGMQKLVKQQPRKTKASVKPRQKASAERSRASLPVVGQHEAGDKVGETSNDKNVSQPTMPERSNSAPLNPLDTQNNQGNVQQ